MIRGTETAIGMMITTNNMQGEIAAILSRMRIFDMKVSNFIVHDNNNTIMLLNNSNPDSMNYLSSFLGLKFFRCSRDGRKV